MTARGVQLGRVSARQLVVTIHYPSGGTLSSSAFAGPPEADIEEQARGVYVTITGATRPVACTSGPERVFARVLADANVAGVLMLAAAAL